jgi:hypothetical protein
MTSLTEARTAWETAKAKCEALITLQFPGADVFHWYRALSHVAGDNVRRNDDTSRDEAMAASEAIRMAHDDYIAKLHIFYRLRDGDRGVLGGRGL